MKKILLIILWCVITLNLVAQPFQFFNTERYKKDTITDYFNLSIQPSDARFKFTINNTDNGGCLINEAGVIVGVPGQGITLKSYTAKGVFVVNSVGNPLNGYYSGFVFGLTPSTYYYSKAYAINVVDTVYSSLIAFTTTSGVGLASVLMDYVQNVTLTSADWQGYAINNAGGTISDKGFCWNLTGNPTLTDSHISIGSGNGTFNYTKTGLSPGTTYYVDAYATNEAGTAYSNHIAFTTLSSYTLPTVTTTAVTNIGINIATSGGNVTADGGLPVTARGVVWNVAGSPTITNNYGMTTDGTGTGIFVSSLTPLSLGASYYVRAYATNSYGTAYGAEIQFYTPSLPTVVTATHTSVTSSGAICGGNVTFSGNTDVTSRGTCWSTSANPTLSNFYTTDGRGIGVYTSTLSSLKASTLYHYRAYASNIVGTVYGGDSTFTTSAVMTLPTVFTYAAYSVSSTTAFLPGEVTSDGGSPVTDKGFVIGLSTDPDPTTTTNLISIGGTTGIGPFTARITILTPGTSYKFRAYAINSLGTAYGATLTFTTTSTSTIPTVTTTVVSNILDSNASSGGNIISDGGSTITARGVVWDTTGSPTITSYVGKTTDGTGIGVFTSTLSSLSFNTTYYYRAYATNANGVSYGEIYSFLSAPNLQVNFSDLDYNYYDTYTSKTSSTLYVSASNLTGIGLYSGAAWNKITITGFYTNLTGKFTGKYNGATIPSYPFDITITGVADPVNTGLSVTWDDPTLTASFTSPYYYLGYFTGVIYDVNGAGRTVNIGLTMEFIKQTLAAATNITSSTADVSVNMVSSIIRPVGEYGFVYSTSTNPTISNNKLPIGIGSVSNYIGTLTGLLPNVVYYVRPYAYWFTYPYYGNQITFSSGCPTIGSSYQGGIVAYVYQVGDPGYVAGECHGIIAATTDVATYPNWSTSVLIGANGTALGTGASNTNLIVAHEGTGTYAARLCYDYTSGGYSDWYLPSNDELEKLYQMYLLGYGTFDWSDGFPPKWWSSTEYDASNAYVLDFSTHTLGPRSKIAGVHVRPIRYF